MILTFIPADELELILREQELILNFGGRQIPLLDHEVARMIDVLIAWQNRK